MNERFRDKLIIASAICLFLAMVLSAVAYAGEKEELEYQVAYWQEHLKALQFDFELSQGKLKEAITKKQEFEKKMKEDVKKKDSN